MDTHQSTCMLNSFRCSMKIMILSHMSIVFLIACFVYLFLTRNIGTPLQNSLSEKQKNLQRYSSHVRAQMFILGVIIGFVVVFIIEPFIASS